MRAISVFSFEAGTSTFGWRAATAFRTRVSMSAMGSLVIVLLLEFLPTGLGHAGDLAIQSELAEAQAADAELAQKRPRPPAAPAAVAVAALQLRRLRLACLLQLQIFRDFGGCGHFLILFLAYCRNGIPICFNSDRPSASVPAVVVMQIFMPLVLSTLE